MNKKRLEKNNKKGESSPDKKVSLVRDEVIMVNEFKKP